MGTLPQTLSNQACQSLSPVAVKGDTTSRRDGGGALINGCALAPCSNTEAISQQETVKPTTSLLSDAKFTVV